MKKLTNKRIFTMIKTDKIKYILLFVTGLILLTSCNHDRNHPGWAYMPDMYYSEAYDSYTPNPVFSDSVTMQEPIPGTIARGTMPYPYKAKNYPDQIRAGVELINPIEITEHDLGKGDGHLYTSKKFPVKPTSLVENYVQNKPDGEIYHVITTGSLSGLMGPHGSMIKPDDRWRIINYVRELAK